jgi:hypothetical protein
MASLLRTTPSLLGAALAAVVGARAAADASGGGAAALSAMPTAKQTSTVALAPRAPALPDRPSADAVPRPAPAAGLLRPGGLALPLAETLATNLVVMQWNRSVGEAPWADVSVASVGRNLRSAWVLDDDQFWVNQFGHPYQGTWSFTAARSSGLGFWGSAPFTFGASALWELAGETTAPSLNDQVTTTVSGVLFGEILYRLSGALRADGGGWREVFASVLAPMGAVNHRLLGTSQAIGAPPSRWQVAIGAAGTPGPAGLRQELGYGALAFTYGVPGSAGLEIEHPLDHFTLEASWTAAADPAATVLARGLVAGSTFDASAARGLWGAFLSFDLDTTPGHRVSTSALGFGGSASAELGGGLALEADAIASAVLLGAGGKVSSPDGLGRDYRFGPGEQALLAVRLAGSRLSAGVSVRQYLLFAADGDSGTEQLLHGTASARLRLVGDGGIGVEVSRYLRRAEIGGETVRQADSVVRLYLVVLGGA